MPAIWWTVSAKPAAKPSIAWAISCGASSPRTTIFCTWPEKMNYFGEGLMHSVDMGFSFRFNGQVEKVLLTMEQRKNLYLIYKEAMNNAAKYSAASGGGRVGRKRQKNTSVCASVTMEKASGPNRKAAAMGYRTCGNVPPPSTAPWR